MVKYLIFYKHYKVTIEAMDKESALDHASKLFKPRKNETIGAWRLKACGAYDDKNQS